MKKNLLIPNLVLAGATSLAAMLTPVAAKAVSATYKVDRSWTDGSSNASLVGTVDVPLGSYAIQSGSGTLGPFTNVNLTLKVDSNSFPLNISAIVTQGANAKFLVNATSSALTFDTSGASADGDYALLNFLGAGDYAYSIATYGGIFGGISLESAVDTSETNSPVSALVDLPVTFGTPIPEPLTILGTGVVLGALPVLKKEYAKKKKKKDGDT